MQIGIGARALAERGVALEGPAKVLESVLAATGEALEARRVVERAGIVRPLGEHLLHDLHRGRGIAGLDALGRSARVLPRRDPERLLGTAADAEERRPGLVRHGAALHRRVAHEHERAGRRVHLLAVDGEGRVPGDDDVELLLPAVPVQLVVLLDDDARRDGDVRVDAERADVEEVANEVPVVAMVRPQALDVRELGDCVGLAHRARSSSSTTGSTRRTPSTRSSRFSFPAQLVKASSRSPS